MRTCPLCNTSFSPKRKDQIFCNDSCRKRLYEMKQIYNFFHLYYYRYGNKIYKKRRKVDYDLDFKESLTTAKEKGVDKNV